MTDSPDAAAAAVRAPPLWAFRLLPDVRGWALAASVAITFKLLSMIEKNPALLANASFMQFAGIIASGTVIIVYMNLFGGTKSGTEAQTKTTEALIASGTASGGSPTVSAPSSGAQTIINNPTPVDPNAPVAPVDDDLAQPPMPGVKP